MLTDQLRRVARGTDARHAALGLSTLALLNETGPIQLLYDNGSSGGLNLDRIDLIAQ